MLWKYKSSYKKTQNLSYVENGKERETLQHCMADLFSSQQMTLYTHTHIYRPTHKHIYATHTDTCCWQLAHTENSSLSLTHTHTHTHTLSFWLSVFISSLYFNISHHTVFLRVGGWVENIKYLYAARHGLFLAANNVASLKSGLVVSDFIIWKLSICLFEMYKSQHSS